MSDPPGSPRAKNITITDVAAAAGVSKSMVSYALNGRAGVNAHTRARIVETARALGWTPSLRGRALSASRAFTVGLIFHRTVESLSTDQYYTLFMAGIQSVLGPRGYALVTEVVATDEDERAAYLQFGRDGRVDGFMLTDLRDDDPRPGYIVEHGITALLMEPTPEPLGLPIMNSSDDGPATRAVIAHLAGLGHRKIGIVSGIQELVSGRRRRTLYQDALGAQGLEPDRWAVGDYSPESGAAATQQLLDSGDPPTAIVYANDMMAIAGVAAIQKRGLRVPEDVSVVGWEDIPLAALLEPALSSVVNDPFEVGATGARALLDVIGGTTFTEEITLRNPQFVARASSGPAPSP